MSVRIKNQHYVPRFLIREFRISGNTKKQVWCFDKLKDKVFLTSIDNICAEKAFYDYDQDQGLEKAFGEMESNFCGPYRLLLNSKNISSLSIHERVGIAVFIATQHMRTRSLRNTIIEASNVAADLFYKNLDNKTDLLPPEYDFRKEASAKKFQFQIMNNAIPKFSEILLLMKWVLLRNETDHPFWCSDNPFSYANDLQYDPHDGLGFERLGSQTYFPLSPYLSLAILDPRLFPQYPDAIPINNFQNIAFINHLQVKNSERYIFSSTQDFTLAKQMISEEPSLRCPSQGRFNQINLEKLKH